VNKGGMSAVSSNNTVTNKTGLLGSGYGSQSGDGTNMATNMEYQAHENNKAVIVTQPSPKLFNVYRNEILAQESKQLKVIPMTGYCNPPAVCGVGATKITQPNPDGIGSANVNSIPTIGPQYNALQQVFYVPQNTFAAEEEYIVNHVPKNVCRIHFGKTLQPDLIDHGSTPIGKPAPCCHATGNKSCYNCIMPGHFLLNA